jgi:hypothetical protein
MRFYDVTATVCLAAVRLGLRQRSAMALRHTASLLQLWLQAQWLPLQAHGRCLEDV